MRPDRLVGASHADASAAFGNSRGSGLMDAGLFMGRSFRVGWGPGWVLTHSGDQLSGTPRPQQPTDTFSMMPTRTKTRSDSVYKVCVERVEGLLRSGEQLDQQRPLQISLCHSEVLVPEGGACPLVRPRQGAELLHDYTQWVRELNHTHNHDTGSIKLGLDKYGEADNDLDGVIAAPAAPLVPLRPVYDGPMPTPPQKAFQPGSTPSHLMHRFMMWNSVGIVRGYNDEQDNAIDVEFHDTAVHHAMHLTNSLGHITADLSQEAVLLACPSTDELASKLQCLHFSSWDTNKEWMVDLPSGEDVRALCLGQGWAAVATSGLMILFSIGGVQRDLWSLPWPVVCMAGHGEQLLVVYHRATGFDGEQALGFELLQLGRRKRQIINGDLPLSRRSYLSWLGFTAEGTPCYVDSEGVVRLLNRSLWNTWIPVCNTREHCKGKSDHYWVVGAHENPEQLRCIPCKGSRFPPTLPRPAVAVLPFNLPVCQTTTEKGQMEVLGSGKPSPSSGQPGPRVTDVLDSMASCSSAGKQTPVLKPLAPKPKTKGWTERAKGQGGNTDLKKRKRDGDAENDNMEVETDESNAKKKPLDTSAKLSAFAFNKS